MNRLLTQQEICELIRISYPTLARWLTAGIFPQPINGRGRKLLWTQATIEEWMNRRQSAAAPMVKTLTTRQRKKLEREYLERQQRAAAALQRHELNHKVKTTNNTEVKNGTQK